MFPQAYVETIQSSDTGSATTTSNPISQPFGWGLGAAAVSQPAGLGAAAVSQPAASQGSQVNPAFQGGLRTSDSSWGDEWNSSDDDSQSSAAPVTGVSAQAPTPGVSATNYSVVKKQYSTQNDKSGDKKSFSLGKIPFGKSGAFDNYLVGATEASATVLAESIVIGDDGSGYFHWTSSGPNYTCTVGAPKKGAKFGGLKAYMTYPVTPSFNNIQVSRRYKHFDWLYERLTEKYGAVIAIPPLPDKQVVGRFEEELIENRRIELQSFTDRICRHPVLGQSAVWKHFITETDERRWTIGKRKAESDPLVGAAFLTTLQTPEVDLRDDEITDFGSTLYKVESAAKTMFSNSQDQSSRCRGLMKKDVESVAASFLTLGQSLNGQIPALQKIGESFEKLTDVFETQATKCWEPLVHLMHDYKGLVNSWDSILSSFNNAKDRQKELESGPSEKERFASRTRINMYRMGVVAEKNYFLQEVQADLDHAAQTFVVEQINHHRELMSRLETLYSQCWGGAGPLPPPSPLPASQAVLLPPTSSGLNAWNESIYEEMP